MDTRQLTSTHGETVQSWNWGGGVHLSPHIGNTEGLVDAGSTDPLNTLCPRAVTNIWLLLLVKALRVFSLHFCLVFYAENVIFKSLYVHQVRNPTGIILAFCRKCFRRLTTLRPVAKTETLFPPIAHRHWFIPDSWHKPFLKEAVRANRRFWWHWTACILEKEVKSSSQNKHAQQHSKHFWQHLRSLWYVRFSRTRLQIHFCVVFLRRLCKTVRA